MSKQYQPPKCPTENDQLSQQIWQDPALEKALQVIDKSNKKSKTAHASYWFSGLAASILIMVSVGMWQSTSDKPEAVLTIAAQTIATSKAEQQNHTLTDGSLVKLNADTAMQVTINDTERLVTLLHGEAYFDVAHNPQKQFQISSEFGKVQVIGTAFNLDQDEQGLDIRVYDGVVRVSNNQGKQVQLIAGQGLTISKLGLLGTIEYFDSQLPEDWTTGVLQAKNMTLNRIIERLNRHTHKALYLEPGLGKRQVTGSFKLSKVSDSIQLLSKLYDLEVIESKDSVYLVAK